MTQYIKNFIIEESGVETIEWVGVLAVAAGLIAVIAKVGSSMKRKEIKANGLLDHTVENSLDLSKE